MPFGAGEGTEWRLHRVGVAGRSASVASPLLDAWEDLEADEHRLGIAEGQPFLLRPDGVPDRDVLGYFNSRYFRRYSPQTQTSYAGDLKVHLSFLESQGIDWRDATDDDLLNYEFWRRRDARNSRRVGGAKFARELAACRSFYEWQVARGAMARSPVVVRMIGRRDARRGGGAALRPSDARPTRVKWLTPRAYRRWRDVGLAGYGADGMRDRSWRSRNDGRNLALADALWASGLRLQEGTTLLTLELPVASDGERFVRSRLADAVAKGGRGRDFWISARALRSIDAYRTTTRADAVGRAQAEGRYDELEGLMVATGTTSRRELIVTDRCGIRGRIPLDVLSVADRRRVFVEGDGGLEPAMLWVTEAGMPMPCASWEMVFVAANKRCARLDVPIRCHPHMLRHSFALRMLVTLVHAFDRRLGLTSEERHDYRVLFGDPWVLVQTLLGHRSLDTTRDIYLEPVTGLQVELFLNGEDDDDAPVSALLSRIATQSPRVQDEVS